MIPDTDRITSVAAVLAMVVLVVTALPAAADVLSTDTSTTDATSTVSDIQSGTTIEGVTGDSDMNGSHTVEVVAQNATTDPVMEIGRNASSHVAARNASMVSGAVGSEGTHFTGNFSNGSLASVEHAINENVTLEATFYNNSTDETVDHSFEFHVNYTNATTTETIDDGDVDAGNIVSVREEDGPLGLTIGPFGADETEIDTTSRKVAGQNTDVVIVLDNASAADDYDRAVDSDTASGDALFAMPLSVLSDDVNRDKVLTRVYYKEAPSDVDATEDTYAVYHEDYGGEQALVVNLGDRFEDADSVEVRTLGGVSSLRALQHQIATTSVGQTVTDAIPMQALGGAGGLLAAVTVPLAARRRQEAM